MKQTYSVSLAELQNRNSAVYEQLYSAYYPVIERFVQQNSGTYDDAQDVFQETMLVILEKTSTSDFTLTSSLKTYLFSVASNIWLKRLRTNRRFVHSDADVSSQCYEMQPEITPPVTLLERLNRWLLTIPQHCQRLLKTLYFLNKTVDAVREEYGFSTVHSVQNQKYKCLQKLRNQPIDIDYLPEPD